MWELFSLFIVNFMVLSDIQLYSTARCVVFFDEITILTPKNIGRLEVYESLFVFFSINPGM